MSSMSKKKKKMSGIQRRNTINFYLYISPWLLFFIVLTVYPMLKSLSLAFTDSDFSGKGNFIGLNNFIQAFTVDVQFKAAFRNTICYVLMYVPLSLILSFFLGWLLSRKVKLLGFWRTVFYMPYITSGVAVTILWGWIFNGTYGIINYVLSLFGITGPNWLGDKRLALGCIVVMSLWSLGNQILIMLAGIQDIPDSYYESAQIDGASTIRQVFAITLPLSTPTIFFNLVIGVISAFQLFNQPYILTNGGPVDSTLTVAMVIFRNAFQYGKMGYASCIAWCLFIVIMIFTGIINATQKKWVFYDN
ncbi:MAG: sugar ABC transporter permease [Lachnospiraceae bacterium]|nr:sugar ABC transporter permease [Lachnospiraceae bacterium]